MVFSVSQLIFNLVGILQCKYTVSQKKQDTYTLAHNFTKYSPIFKILSLLDSVGNL